MHTIEVPAYCWSARCAHVSLCAVRIGGMSAAASGVSRQGRLGAAQQQWMRQRRGGSGAGSPGMAAASPDLPPAKRRRVSFDDKPETREYTPAPSPAPRRPPARVVGGRRVRGGRRGARARAAGAALKRGLSAADERTRFLVAHALTDLIIEVEAVHEASAFYDECVRCRLALNYIQHQRIQFVAPMPTHLY